jgi:hypothetical protein
MKTFKINDKYEILCESLKTRNGFKHEAKLFRTGLSGTTVCIEKAKICYLNRTWECFEFESVIYDLLKKAKIMTIEEQNRYMDLLNKKEFETINKQFASIGMIAKLGGILTENKIESNDWKKRMLLAGLPGLDIPADWNTLTESEKENRLNNVINELSNK